MTTANPRKANGHRRRQVRARVLAEEHTCALCGEPVDKTLTVQWGVHGLACHDPGCPGCVPHPDRPEVDEKIPVSLGGSPYDRANTQLTHRRCNQRKSNGEHRARAIVEPMPTSRTW